MTEAVPNSFFCRLLPSLSRLEGRDKEIYHRKKIQPGSSMENILNLLRKVCKSICESQNIRITYNLDALPIAIDNVEDLQGAFEEGIRHFECKPTQLLSKTSGRGATDTEQMPARKIARFPKSRSVRQPIKVVVEPVSQLTPIRAAGTFYQLKQFQHTGSSIHTRNVVPLYIRKEAMDLWQSLSSFVTGRKTTLYVHGPPGTGKSSITWAWTCTNSNSREILWVGLKRTSYAHVVELSKGKLKASLQDVINLPGLIRDFPGNTMIIDGLTHRDVHNHHTTPLGSAQLWQMEKPDAGRKLVLVASEAKMFGDKELLSVNWDTKFSPSWTKLQYLAASESDEFYAATQQFLQEDLNKAPYHFESSYTAGQNLMITTKDGTRSRITLKRDYQVGENTTFYYAKDRWVEEKFYVAGMSARWFWSIKREAVRTSIRNHISGSEFVKKIINNTAAERNAKVTNSLRAAYLPLPNSPPEYCFVSKYALRCAVKVIELSFMDRLTTFSQSKANSSFDGWVFEFDFLAQIRRKIGAHLILSPINARSIAGRKKKSDEKGRQKKKSTETVTAASSSAATAASLVTQAESIAARSVHLQGSTRWLSHDDARAHSHTHSRSDHNTIGRKLKVMGICSFDTIEDIAKLKERLTDGAFLLPEKWNQAGFDAVYITRYCALVLL